MATLRCRVTIEWRDKTFSYDHRIGSDTLNQIEPQRIPIDLMDLAHTERNGERRRRVINMISAGISHALTEAFLAD